MRGNRFVVYRKIAESIKISAFYARFPQKIGKYRRLIKVFNRFNRVFNSEYFFNC